MGRSKIKEIKAREILDSRGIPTLEAEVLTGDGIFKAAVPSGVSKGKYEAVELRDGDRRYNGKGVKKAVKNVNEIISPKLKGKDTTKQKEIDNILITLDGTDNKSNLGANAVLAVSLAVCRAGAFAKNIPLWKWISQLSQTKPSLPTPGILYMEGGLHGRGDLDVQEFIAVSSADSFEEKLRLGTEIYHQLSEILQKRYGKTSTNVGLEGAFTPPLSETKEAIELLLESAEMLGYKNQIKIILDVAASSFFENGKYNFEKKTIGREKMLEFYKNLCNQYPIIAIEDPFGEEDWEGFQKITESLGGKITIIGDDLLVTNLKRMKEAFEKKACNGVILKPNQIGTVSETIEAAKFAFEKGWQAFVKHRGGETIDDFIADLAVGLGNGWIMSGAPARGERVVKYNRLLKIEEEI